MMRALIFSLVSVLPVSCWAVVASPQNFDLDDASIQIAAKKTGEKIRAKNELTIARRTELLQTLDELQSADSLLLTGQAWRDWFDKSQATIQALMPFAGRDPVVKKALLSAMDSERLDYIASAALVPLYGKDKEVTEKFQKMLSDKKFAAIAALMEKARQDPRIKDGYMTLLKDPKTSVIEMSYVVNALAPLAQKDDELRAILLDRFSDIERFIDQEGDYRNGRELFEAYMKALSPLVRMKPVRDAMMAKLNSGNSSYEDDLVEALAPLVATDAEVRAAVLKSFLNDTYSYSIEKKAGFLAPVCAEPEVAAALLKMGANEILNHCTRANVARTEQVKRR